MCCLVVVGVRVDGTKGLVALVDGCRESIESWADLLGDLKRRGMRSPTLAVGTGWKAAWQRMNVKLREVAEHIAEGRPLGADG